MLTENGKGYTALQLDVISVLFFCKKSLLASHAFALFERTTSWRASVASETLTGVTQSKIGDVCLFVYIYGRTYVILYFDPPYFCVRSAFDPVPNFTKQNPPV